MRAIGPGRLQREGGRTADAVIRLWLLSPSRAWNAKSALTPPWQCRAMGPLGVSTRTLTKLLGENRSAPRRKTRGQARSDASNEIGELIGGRLDRA